MSKVNLDSYPALNFLLTQDRSTPFECCDCPFGKDAGDGDFIEFCNPSDPGEGYYECSLLTKEEIADRVKDCFPGTVWGENPACELEDWQKRALGELEEHFKG